MKTLRTGNNNGLRNQVTLLRRSNMKRKLTAGIIGGIAIAAIVGAAIGLTAPNNVESVSTIANSTNVEVNRVETGLPSESFAYFSIDGENSVMDGRSKVVTPVHLDRIGSQTRRPLHNRPAHLEGS